jgi:hypothetical protein
MWAVEPPGKQLRHISNFRKVTASALNYVLSAADLTGRIEYNGEFFNDNTLICRTARRVSAEIGGSRPLLCRLCSLMVLSKCCFRTPLPSIPAKERPPVTVPQLAGLVSKGFLYGQLRTYPLFVHSPLPLQASTRPHDQRVG